MTREYLELPPRDSERKVEQPAVHGAAMLRQRYECTCGYHGTRELHAPPAHIRCPRCNGVAIARGRAEAVE